MVNGRAMAGVALMANKSASKEFHGEIPFGVKLANKEMKMNMTMPLQSSVHEIQSRTVGADGYGPRKYPAFLLRV